MLERVKLVLALAAVLLARPVAAQDPFGGSDSLEVTVRVLREQVAVESSLLAAAEAERRANLEALKLASTQLSRASAGVLSAMDLVAAALAGEEDEAERAGDALADAQETLAESEQEVALLLESSAVLGRHIQEHVDRLAGYQSRLRALEVEAPATRGPLAGTWSVTIGPDNDTGTLVLRQFGTLVAGQYTLASGRNGSIRGTVVANKVQVEAIDSRVGRSATYYGIHDPGTSSLSGTWEAIRLASGRAAFGSWKATKRKDE